MIDPKFIITRFTHGSGGKFLSTVLQTSKNVDHWNTIIESYKNHELCHKLMCGYTERSFPVDSLLHLQNEPMVPYNTDLYSSTYERGIDITLSQFVEHACAINDVLFLNAVKQGKFVNLIMHKPFLPKFCYGSKTVTVLVETKKELNWLHRANWAKHYLEQENYIYYLPNHPQYCNFKNLPTVSKFSNPYQFPIEQKEQIIQEKIVHSEICQYYQNQTNFSVIDPAYNIDNIFIPLSCFFNVDRFLKHIDQIFVEFNLGNPNVELIKKIHSIWLSRQVMYS
jgi:hypothetical protein